MVDLLEAADLGIGSAVATPATETRPTNGHIATATPFYDVPKSTTQRARATRSDKGTSRAAVSNGKVARGLLYFDIETIPDYSRFDQFGLDPIPEPAKRTAEAECPNTAAKFLDKTVDGFKDEIRRLNPDDAYLDQLESVEKAASKPRKGILDLIADVRNQDAERLAKVEQQRKEMATCPEMNRVVALGWGHADGMVRSLVVGEKTPESDAGSPVEIDERYILETFWHLLAIAAPVIGFNILGFDLPTIYIRSMLLDVKPSRRLDLKPWGSDCVDLMAVRFPKSSAKRLKWLAQAMGIEVPAGDVDGSQVEELWKADPAKVGLYVRSDVQITRELHQFYKGYFC